ncbi:MAG: hypothetical protein OXJ37_06630 [Bryobacterales bacterium]|nr:hypothetical protein [Bryobacterales bacterium]MDE0623973.1 hypothetical protein [Bryobacterales bacterium]
MATPKADSVSNQIVDTLAEEFMKGFRAMDDDLDGEVDVAAMIQTLKAFGYGQAQPIRRGRGGGADPFDLFERADADGDGILREDEAGPFVRGTRYFQDGEVTLEEFQKAWAELAARRGGRGGGARGSGGSAGGGRGGGGQSSDIEFLAALDANGDRTLTAQEARAAIEAEIEEAMDTRVSLDVNQDGEISAREYGLSQPSTGREVDADGLDGHARGHFEREDFDRNGVITLDEIAERAARDPARRLRAMQLGVRIARADANGDSKLAWSELQAASGKADWTVLGVTERRPLEMVQLYPRLYGAEVDQAADLDRVLSAE